MLEFITNREDLRAELTEEIRQFLPNPAEIDLRIEHEYSVTDGAANADETLGVNTDGVGGFCADGKKTVRNFVRVAEREFCYESPLYSGADKTVKTRLDVRECKISLYKALSAYFKRCLPWGSLTGIRPTKPLAQLLSDGKSPQDALDDYKKIYSVSEEKARLTERILRNQKEGIGDRFALAASGKTPPFEHLSNLYVHIPFCVTRCNYCSFVSTTVDKQKWLVQPYIDALCAEIEQAKQLLADVGHSIFSVYAGGGTPTAVTADQLSKVLSAAFVEGVEYTCEAGRPDTIDDEKLAVMNGCGVNRISVNPQTLSDETLLRIGRRHTAQDFFDAYALAEKYGFRKNVDLIAGLSGETLGDFMRSVDGVIDLSPENITVHTLSIKRGSSLAGSTAQSADAKRMVDYSVEKLTAAGYLPYYLYRQKQMAGNLENIGWSKPGCMSVNNISVMEEMLSVMACGAGAISKRIFGDGRIERLANIRDIILYLDRFDERLKKKELFYSNQFTSD